MSREQCAVSSEQTARPCFDPLARSMSQLSPTARGSVEPNTDSVSRPSAAFVPKMRPRVVSDSGDISPLSRR